MFGIRDPEKINSGAWIRIRNTAHHWQICPTNNWIGFIFNFNAVFIFKVFKFIFSVSISRGVRPGEQSALMGIEEPKELFICKLQVQHCMCWEALL
jgi:hypothetical protein